MAEQSILEKQEETKNTFLVISVLLLFCFNIMVGASWVYGGLTLEHHRGGEEQEQFLQLTEDEGSWYMSIVPIVNVLGSVAAFPIGEWLGRKKVLMMSTVLNITGFVIIYFSKVFWVLAFGRGLSQFGIGLGVMMPFILISEITIIKFRAPLSVINILSMSVGILFSFFFLFIFSAASLIFFECGLGMLFLVLSPLLPESPHFLVRKNRLEEARRVLIKLRGDVYKGVEEEVQEIIMLTELRKVGGKTSLFARWKKRTFLQPLSILMVLMFFISVNGVDCPMNFYGPSMFAEFGFSISPRLLACVIPVGQLLGYCIAPLLMKVMSKKTQYILATSLMAASLGGLALSYYAKETGFEPSIAGQAGLMVCSLGLTCGYGLGTFPTVLLWTPFFKPVCPLGMGSVSYAMPGELLSPEDKTIGMNIAQCVRMLGTAALLKVYPFLVATLGYPVLFLCHAAILLSAAAFVTCFLPETRNKSLTEIHQLFTGKQA